MRALDLFCGAGGASIGLKAAGYDVIAYDKWDDALATHNLNGMWAAELDLSTVTAEQWREAWGGGEIDLLWGSPPCQGWSQGGKHLGENDPRNGFPWALAAIEGVRPRLVLMENVKGITYKKNAPYLESEVMVPLRDLGYTAEWQLLNCADYGVPQRRVRTFIVARLDADPVWPTPTHVEPPHHEYTDREPWVTMASALGWVDKQWVGFPRKDDGRASVEIEGVEYRARDLASSDEPAHTLTEKARSWKVYPRLNTGGDWKKGGSREDAQTKDPELEPAPTVRGVPSQSRWQHDDGSHEVVSPEEQAVFQSFPVEAPLPDWAHDEPAPTVSTTFGGVPGRKPSGGHRNLTLAEAMILQAFPGGYEFVGTKTSRYLQIGNACPPPLAFLLARANQP